MCGDDWISKKRNKVSVQFSREYVAIVFPKNWILKKYQCRKVNLKTQRNLTRDYEILYHIKFLRPIGKLYFSISAFYF